MDTASDPVPAPRSLPSRGSRIVFWSWLSVIVVGLAIMISLPLLGR